VHEPFGIIVFQDEQPIKADHKKVCQVNEVDGSLDQIATGLAILVAPDLDAARAYCSKNKIVVTEIFQLTNTLFVEVPAFAAFNEFYISLMNSKLFTSVEPDYIQPYQTDADAYSYAAQWHLPNMQASEAWSLIDGAAYGEVAVLDIACEVGHEDLVGTISKLKVQFLHIGYGSTSSGGFATSDTIVTRAINKAIANPNCLAVSMSWGGGGSTSYPLFQNALTAAKTYGRSGKGIPIFASSGNQSNPNFTQAPAIYPMVHAVGASTQSNLRASFSCSCPVMAAAAASVILANPALTEAQVTDVIRQACRKTGGYVYDVNGKSLELGYGVVNMYNAVTIAKSLDGGDPVPVPVAEYNLYGTISTLATAVQGSSVTVTYSVNLDKVHTADVIATVNLTFTRPDGSKFVFYTGDVTIPKGQTVVTKTAPFGLPNNQTGNALFSLTIDPNMVIKETNENDNTISTGLTITLVNPPASGLDASVTIDRYEWLDANRVRIFYTFYNKGSVVITSMKVNHGLVGGFTGTWSRADRIEVGKSATFGSVYNITSPPVALPTDYVLTITAVNGVPDNDSTNNTARMQIKK